MSEKETIKISGAEALVKSLIEEGADTVFGYPGGAILTVYDKLYDYTDRLHHILVRHEQGAVHAAQGYARVSGRTGVVIVTSGPGAANVITGLSDAMADSTPLVVITGQVGRQYLGSDAFQETDVVGITQPITKWAYQVRRPDEVASAVARAFYIASTGRPGPVVLDIAKDAQVGLTDWHYEPVNFIRSYNPLPEIDDTALAEAAALINKAERPMILVGQGVVISGATESLRLLADKASIPVCSTLLGLSAMPSEHRLMKGMLGMHGNIGPNVNTNRADLIIAVGMRFDDRVTGNTAAYAPQAKIIHIDIDPSEFDKTVRSTIAINADARQALERLLPMIDEADHSDWIGSFDRHNDVEREKVVAVELKRPEGSKLTMGEVISKISDATGHRAVAVTDVGQNQMMSARYFKFTSPRSFISSGGLGTMGFGLPAAIGAKIAAPERTVCLFCGDGGFQMTIQELGTIMEYEVGVKMVILNNNFLGNVRQWQNLFYQRRFSQTPMMNPDFIKITSAYGIQGEDVIDRESLDGAISRMLADDRPYLLNVQIDETDMVFPMTPAGQAVDHVLLSADCPYNPNQD